LWLHRRSAYSQPEWDVLGHFRRRVVLDSYCIFKEGEMMDGYRRFLLQVSYLKRLIKKETICRLGLHSWNDWEETEQDSFERHCFNCLKWKTENRPNPYVDPKRDADRICLECWRPISKHQFTKYHDVGKVMICPDGEESEYETGGFGGNRWRSLHIVKLKE